MAFQPSPTKFLEERAPLDLAFSDASLLVATYTAKMIYQNSDQRLHYSK